MVDYNLCETLCFRFMAYCAVHQRYGHHICSQHAQPCSQHTQVHASSRFVRRVDLSDGWMMFAWPARSLVTIQLSGLTRQQVSTHATH